MEVHRSTFTCGSMQSHLDRMVISRSGADFSTTGATAEALLRVTSENIYIEPPNRTLRS